MYTKSVALTVLILVAFMPSLSGCSTAKAPGEIEYSTYENSDYGVRLLHPSTWSVKERDFGFMLNVGFVPPQGAYAVELTVSMPAEEEATVDEIVETLLVSAAITYDDFELLESGDATLCGLPAKKILIRGKLHNRECRYVAIVTVRYVFGYGGQVDEHSKYQEIADEMIASLELVRAETPTPKPIATTTS